MRAAPAFRERLSDFEAVSTGSFSNNGRRRLGIMPAGAGDNVIGMQLY
jgi:hypothetical protein